MTDGECPTTIPWRGVEYASIGKRFSLSDGNSKCKDPTLSLDEKGKDIVSTLEQNSRQRVMTRVSFTTLPKTLADFDGDELNLWLMLDHKQQKAFSVLKPANTVWDLQTPGKISGLTALEGPVIATLANFFSHG